MQYLSVRATEGLLTIDSIPFQTLEFTHDIDSLKDLCTSLIRFESKLDEWNAIRLDADHYLSTLGAQACSPKMLAALGDSLLDSLANFKAEPIEGELIINVVEKGDIIYGKGKDDGVPLTIETLEIGGNTDIEYAPIGKKRPLREAFDADQLTLKMQWQPRVTDIDVVAQLSKVYGVDKLDSIVSISIDVPSNSRLTHFTLTADVLNDYFYGSYTVQIEWTGKRPQRAATMPEPAMVDINMQLGDKVKRELTLSATASPSAAEMYAMLLEDAEVVLPRMPLFMPVAWPKDMRDKPTKVQLYVSPEDGEYVGEVWVIIHWHSRNAHAEVRRHISELFNSNKSHSIKMLRRTNIKPHDVFYALNSRIGEAMPDVLFADVTWTIGVEDKSTKVELVVSPDDVNYYGGVDVHIAWL